MGARTKIICTIGPAVSSLEKMLALIDSGMNVARINFSHGTHEDHQKTIDNLKKAREIKGVPLAIMLDNKGPEVRIGQIIDGGVEVNAGDEVFISSKPVKGSVKHFSITPEHIITVLNVGDRVLIDDGYIESEVIEKTREGITIKIANRGRISSHKGVNIPDVDLNLPALTDKDLADIKFGCENDVDIIAASFIRTADDVLVIKQLLHDLGKPETLVIAKIESSVGVKNFDHILAAADGIMVARGDLGVEVPLHTVPVLQKMMIQKSYTHAKISVTATQMLESMIHNPRPTRAEVSDVANAIYDSTSAVMLSGETAVGKFPIEACKMMQSVINEAEKDFDYRTFFYGQREQFYNDISSAVALAAVKTSYSSQATAMFTFSSSGYTARVMSRFRPQMSIIALTEHAKTYHQLAVSWGVIPALTSAAKDVQDAFIHASCFAISHKLASYGDLVVVTAGSAFGIAGTTNTMIVRHIGDVLVRGKSSESKRVYGAINVLLTEDPAHTLQEKIVVIPRCQPHILPHLESAKAIILQNSADDVDSQKRLEDFAKEKGIPYITRADGATTLLKDGDDVTLDPVRGLVFKGEIPSDDEIVARVCKKS